MTTCEPITTFSREDMADPALLFLYAYSRGRSETWCAEHVTTKAQRIYTTLYARYVVEQGWDRDYFDDAMMALVPHSYNEKRLKALVAKMEREQWVTSELYGLNDFYWKLRAIAEAL